MVSPVSTAASPSESDSTTKQTESYEWPGVCTTRTCNPATSITSPSTSGAPPPWHSFSAKARTGAPVSRDSSADASVWSMWWWVIRISSTGGPEVNAARWLGSGGPGSTTTALRPLPDITRELVPSNVIGPAFGARTERMCRVMGPSTTTSVGASLTCPRFIGRFVGSSIGGAPATLRRAQPTDASRSPRWHHDVVKGALAVTALAALGWGEYVSWRASRQGVHEVRGATTAVVVLGFRDGGDRDRAPAVSG